VLFYLVAVAMVLLFVGAAELTWVGWAGRRLDQLVLVKK
jgi:hypothetical protein